MMGMRWSRIGLAVAVCVVILSMGSTIRAATETVRVEFDLDSGPAQELDLTLAIEGGDSDTDTSTVTGAIVADLRIDFDDVTGVGNITGVEFLDDSSIVGGSRINLSDVSFSVLGGLLQVDAHNLSSTLSTPAPFSSVVGGSFNMANHTLIVDEGTVEVRSVLGDQDINLSDNPAGGPLEGIGSLTLTGPQVNGADLHYTVDLLLPIDFGSVVYNDESIEATLSALGDISVSGQFSRVIPEPASLALVLGGAAVMLGRRRR